MLFTPARIFYVLLSSTLVLLNLYYYEANYNYLFCHISKRRTTTEENTRNAKNSTAFTISRLKKVDDVVNNERRNLVVETDLDTAALLSFCVRRKSLLPGNNLVMAIRGVSLSKFIKI